MSLTLEWSDFYDVHTEIVETRVGVGSFATGSDILNLAAVSAENGGKITFDTLALINGMSVFCTVQACDRSGLCADPISSEAMLVDHSKPNLRLKNLPHA